MFAARDSDFDKTVLSSIASILAKKLIDQDESSVSKICFAALSREARRRPQYVADILHEVYIENNQSRTLLKALFTGEILCDLKSVRLGFEIFCSLPTSEDRQWALSPCWNCRTSPELDELIL